MKTGISTASYFGKLFVEDTIDLIGQAGAKKAEVFLNSPSELNHIFVKKIREKADNYGISIDSVHPFGIQYELQLFAVNERIVDDARDIYRRVLEAGKILGAKYYIFHGGMYFKPKDKRPLNFKNIGRNINILADMSSDYGIKLAYENVYWCWYNYPEFADKLLNETNNENLVFNFDIKQAMLSEKPIKEYLAHMGERLANVHICGLNVNGNEVTTCLPGKGDYDLGELKKTLSSMGYGGNVIVEVYANDFKDYDELAGSYQYVKELFEG